MAPGFDENVLVHGLQPVRVEIVEYDPAWPARFAGRAAELRGVLGDRARLIEHVGSTSVPGLAAKPVIDIAVAVDDPDDEPAYLPDLLAAGYELRVREPRHRCLQGGDPGLRTNLHCHRPGDVEVRRYLAFRDRLRASAADRGRYAVVKRALAGRGEWADMNLYAEAKGPVVASILANAGWVDPR